MDTQNICTKFHGLSLVNGVDIQTFVRRTFEFCVVICNYLVLVQDRVVVYIHSTAAQIRAQYGRRIISASSLILGQHTDVRNIYSTCSNCGRHCPQMQLIQWKYTGCEVQWGCIEPFEMVGSCPHVAVIVVLVCPIPRLSDINICCLLYTSPSPRDQA